MPWHTTGVELDGHKASHGETKIAEQSTSTAREGVARGIAEGSFGSGAAAAKSQWTRRAAPLAGVGWDGL
jgi:UDP-3-O-[3-hydroxymyristoyl] glucosamine N-acyltransferase